MAYNFNSVIDALNFAINNKNLNYLTRYTTLEGEFSFGYDCRNIYTNTPNLDIFYVYRIMIQKDKRNKGILKSMIKHIFNNYDEFWILSVGTQLLDDILIRYGFEWIDCDFLCRRNKFIYQ